MSMDDIWRELGVLDRLLDDESESERTHLTLVPDPPEGVAEQDGAPSRISYDEMVAALVEPGPLSEKSVVHRLREARREHAEVLARAKADRLERERAERRHLTLVPDSPEAA